MWEIIKDKNFDYRSVVINGYNDCAYEYMANKNGTERSLEYIFENVPSQARILDFGCGSGIPVSRDLSEEYEVLGVDISEKQIQLAKANVPNAKFMNSDILDTQFEAKTFSAIVSFYALFHLPKEKHEGVLAKFYNWLKPKGVLLITVGNTDEPPYIERDFFGVTMFWSNFGRTDYLEMAKRIGFTTISKPEYEYTDGERHPIIIGIK
jgi:2-polyprenyl-3-methyl-5-hydroxy-6-metoxy-1,4-benzoquinol methylase